MTETAPDEVGTDELFTFSSSSPASKRWVWHPSVHQEFRETCFFFLVRMARSDIPGIHDGLKALVDRARLVAYTIHPLLGYYDGLIRVWATEERRREFLVLCHQPSSGIEALYEFRTDLDGSGGISYAWWPESSTPLLKQDVAGQRDTIKEVADAYAKGYYNSPVVKSQLANLVERGFLRLYDPGPLTSDSIRTCVIFDSDTSYDRADVAQLTTRVVSHLTSPEPRLNRVATYCGVGFGRVVVDVASPNFGSLAEDTETLSGIASSLAFRTMTLVLLTGRSGESDALDTSAEDLSYPVQRFLRDLAAHRDDPDGTLDRLRTRFVGLHPIDQESYAQIYREFRALLDSPRGTQFYNILHAVLMNDVEEFGDALVFLHKTEGLLRKLLRRIWIETLGDQWLDRVRKAIHQLVQREKRDNQQTADFLNVVNGDAQKWGMAVLVEASRALAALVEADADAAAVTSEVDKLLGATWRSTIKAVLRYRNDQSHGRVYEYPDLSMLYPTEDGRDHSDDLRALLRAGEIYLYLVTVAT